MNSDRTTRRRWWPRAAPCAFLSAFLGLASFLLTRQQSRAMQAAGSSYYNAPHYVVLSVVIMATGALAIAANVTAMLGVMRRQRFLAPRSARWGEWMLIAYVAGPLLAALSIALVPWVFRDFSPLSSRNFVIGFSMIGAIPWIFVLSCAGWASRGGVSLWQRRAATGLFASAAFGILRLTLQVLGLLTANAWLWLQPLQVMVHTATWVAIGLWLRETVREAPDAPAAGLNSPDQAGF